MRFNSINSMLREIEAFLNSYLAGKGKSTERQAKIALRCWENYVRQNPSCDVKLREIDQFIFHMSKHLKPRTLLPYLFHIAKYFDWSGRKDLERHVMKERQRLRLKIKGKSPQVAIHHGVLRLLKTVEKPRDKLMLRLLLWSKIPIGCLENLKVRHIIEERRYEMRCNGETISGDLYSNTPMVIKERIEDENLKQDDDLIGINTRQIQNLIPKYAEKVGIPYKITPQDLRKFADNPQRDMVIELYENLRNNGSILLKLKEE